MISNICIIPARGGSKRIPRKNIQYFLGKPIMAYSIEAAIGSNLFKEVMVSTDDKEIAEIALSYGAKVPFFRSDKNSNDFATTIDVIDEVLEDYKNDKQIFEYGCCIYPCAPFVTKKILNKSYNLLKKQDLDCIFPIVSYSFPIQRALKINKKNRIEMFNPKHIQTRSQDLDTSFHDAGQFYFFKVKEMIKKKKLWTDNTGYIELTEMESQDIDNLMDWKLAELKFKLINDI